MGTQAGLGRHIGLWGAVGLVVGVTIGSGIFRTPAGIAARVQDPTVVLLVWIAGGLLSLCGALSVAELAGALPKTGGWYAFLREGWGRLPAFLFGWAELVLIRASAAGAIATVFAEYALRSLGYDPAVRPSGTDLLAGAAIVCTALINIRGVRLGALVTGVSTAAKFGALALIVALAFLLGGTAGASTANFSTTGVVTMAGGASGLSSLEAGAFGLALISVLWAYDGFADVSFAGGEVIEPQRNLPRAIVIGIVAILTIYLAANVAYLYVVPVQEMAASSLIAADTMQRIFGAAGARFVSIVVAISTFGALNATMLVAPRVFFAMADDRLFFRSVAAVHPRYGTPYVAILLAMGLGVAFVFTRTFEQLADTFVLSIWPFYALAVAAIFRLRRLRPDLPRPYRVPGYPIVPAVFIAAAVFLVGNAVVADPLWTGVTFAVVLAGIPVYYGLFRRGLRDAAGEDR